MHEYTVNGCAICETCTRTTQPPEKKSPPENTIFIRRTPTKTNKQNSNGYAKTLNQCEPFHFFSYVIYGWKECVYNGSNAINVLEIEWNETMSIRRRKKRKPWNRVMNEFECPESGSRIVVFRMIYTTRASFSTG